MRKLVVFITCLAVVTFLTCENEPLEDDFITGETTCEFATINSTQAALDFLDVNDDNYMQLCVAYRSALQAQIQSCGDANGAIQMVIEGLGDCSNDDNEQTSDVEGIWLLTAWLGEEPIDLNNDGTENINFLDEMDCYNNETLVFDTNGTVMVLSTSFAEFNVEITIGTEDELTYTIECIDEIENSNGTWTQTDNIISVTSDGSTLDWTLSGNELSILFPEGFDVSNDDGSVTTLQDLTYVYTKQ